MIAVGMLEELIEDCDEDLLCYVLDIMVDENDIVDFMYWDVILLMRYVLLFLISITNKMKDMMHQSFFNLLTIFPDSALIQYFLISAFFTFYFPSFTF